MSEPKIAARHVNFHDVRVWAAHSILTITSFFAAVLISFTAMHFYIYLGLREDKYRQLLYKSTFDYLAKPQDLSEATLQTANYSIPMNFVDMSDFPSASSVVLASIEQGGFSPFAVGLFVFVLITGTARFVSKTLKHKPTPSRS